MSDETKQVLTGHCLCGACAFKLIGAQNWVGHCHCESCRKATASPFTTWIGQEDGAWELTGETPLKYQSSKGNIRGFCGTCGSPMYFKSERFPTEMHFYAALLTRPNKIVPTIHFHADEMLSWVHLSDGLPYKKHDD